jgi:hypothetical protein
MVSLLAFCIEALQELDNERQAGKPDLQRSGNGITENAIFAKRK